MGVWLVDLVLSVCQAVLSRRLTALAEKGLTNLAGRIPWVVVKRRDWEQAQEYRGVLEMTHRVTSEMLQEHEAQSARERRVGRGG